MSTVIHWRPAGVLAGAYPGAKRGHTFALDRGVTHAEVLRAFRLGRFSREPNEALCRGVQRENLGDRFGTDPDDQVTCPRCQDLLSRHANERHDPLEDFF
jgi:hypothetical protein